MSRAYKATDPDLRRRLALQCADCGAVCSIPVHPKDVSGGVGFWCSDCEAVRTFVFAVDAPDKFAGRDTPIVDLVETAREQNG